MPRSDVSAQTQLKSTQAQAIDLKWQRAQMEHAIAVLVGVAPSELEIAVREYIPALPDVPLAVPSQLLSGAPTLPRPSAVMAANANIGVAEAARYPDDDTVASGGYRNSSFSDLFSVLNRFWSLGPQLALTLLDFGSRRAELSGPRPATTRRSPTTARPCSTASAKWENYRAQLLRAGTGAAVQREALEAAQESRLIENQYRAGTVDFLSVATVHSHRVEQPAHQPDPAGDRLTASVLLIAAHWAA